MSDQTRSAAERLVLYLMLLVIAAVWIGFGGLVFVGILQDAAGA
jgi:hypothetical protein